MHIFYFPFLFCFFVFFCLFAQWDGKFAKSGETYLVPERNQSATNDYYGYDTTPTVLPTTWNGKFQLDPNDVRIKPERNTSDVRDYADHRRFITRE